MEISDNEIHNELLQCMACSRVFIRISGMDTDLCPGCIEECEEFFMNMREEEEESDHLRRLEYEESISRGTNH
jgi:hypothetical protein